MGKRRVERLVGKGVAVDVLLGAVVVVAVAGSVMVAAVRGNDTRPAIPVTQAEVGMQPVPGPRLNSVGEWANQGVYVMAVKRVQLDPVGSVRFVPGKGRQYCVVDVELTNMGREPLEVAPVVQMYLRDMGGVTYAMAPAPLDAPLMAGALTPGETRQGQISFSVPKAAANLRLTFDPAPAKAAPVTFELSAR